MNTTVQKITPFLWFDHQAEEAAEYYTSIFKGSSIDGIARYGETGPGPKGTVMTVQFTIEGQQFVALNGGPQFKFTEAISFVVNCETQHELDDLWEKLLSGGGQESQCGWLKDKYGMSWQLVPTSIEEMLQDKNPERSSRVMQAVMKMKKLDIAELQRAFRGD
jgi:predicted 3-demethylubiquinone-9 3-methyltransferase (glyoxalase superfamily)